VVALQTYSAFAGHAGSVSQQYFLVLASTASGTTGQPPLLYYSSIVYNTRSVINDVSLNEGNAGTNSHSRRSAPLRLAPAVTFDIATADLTQVQPSDYTLKISDQPPNDPGWQFDI